MASRSVLSIVATLVGLWLGMTAPHVSPVDPPPPPTVASSADAP